MTATEKKAIEGLASELLDDVGRPNSDEINFDEKSVHIIRRVTIEEERQAKRSK